MPSRTRPHHLAIPCALLAAACAGRVELPADLDRPHEDVARRVDELRDLETQFTVRRRNPVVREGPRAIYQALVALAGEPLGDLEPAQSRDPGRPPLQHLPRITSPWIAEPVEIGPGQTGWIVPLLLSRRALTWDDSTARTWFGWRFDAPEGPLPPVERPVRFWLERHGAPPAKREAVPLQGLGSEVMMSGLRDLTPLPPSLEDDIVAFGFAIPLGEAPGGIAPGFYDIRILPALSGRDSGPGPGPCAGRLHESMVESDWYRALDVLAGDGEDVEETGPSMAAGFQHLADRLEAEPPSYFRAELDGIAEALRLAAGDLEDDPRPGVGCGEHALVVDQAIRRLLTIDLHPAPVLLDAPSDPGAPFSFVVASDVQYGDDLGAVRRFLRLLDPDLVPTVGVEEPRSHGLPTDVLRRLREARFVIHAGDLADGGGFDSSPGTMTLNGLGILPPTSAYSIGGEFPELRAELARFGKPFFSVPGNHDGYASFGGVLNNGFHYAGAALKKVPPPVSAAVHPVGEILERTAGWLPILVKAPRIVEQPFYDGLVEWHHHLGPHNLAFRYRGHSFVGLNTYALSVSDRDSIGGIAFNWGGGVDWEDVVWFDSTLRWLRDGGEPVHQFAFMHHDPRGAAPGETSYEEVHYGIYDNLDTYGNMLTFGYLGLQHSPLNPLFLPMFTAGVTVLPNAIFYGDRFEQEWMGQHFLVDVDNQNAEGLVRTINANLAGRPGGDAGISHLFFGHNALPAISSWVHEDAGGAVFPPPDHGRWEGSPWGPYTAMAPFFKMRNIEPPAWARSIRIRDGRNATVVRVDDVGEPANEHGFFLVTVHPARGDVPGPVEVEWFPVPG